MWRLRAIGWTVRAVREARRIARTGALRDRRVQPPPALPDNASAYVSGALWLARATCLEAALVRQQWYLSRGLHRDLVIGVTPPSRFGSHAWLAGDETGEGYEELLRLPPR